MPLKVKRDDQTAINLTPMIDIVFLLIIFFMVSSHFTNKNHVERDIAISVPQVSASGALTAAPRNRIIDIFSDGRVALDEKVVSINELEARLSDAKQQFNQIGVTVRGDGECAYQHVVEVIATCKRAKIEKVDAALIEMNTLTR
jgi:biopolymer transport protein ExbD